MFVGDFSITFLFKFIGRKDLPPQFEHLLNLFSAIFQAMPPPYEGKVFCFKFLLEKITVGKISYIPVKPYMFLVSTRNNQAYEFLLTAVSDEIV